VNTPAPRGLVNRWCHMVRASFVLLAPQDPEGDCFSYKALIDTRIVGTRIAHEKQYRGMKWMRNDHRTPTCLGIRGRWNV
jgi:hypothetical protein